MDDLEMLLRVIKNLQSMGSDKSIKCVMFSHDYKLESPNKTSEVHYKSDSNRFIASAITAHLPEIFETAEGLARKEVEESIADAETRLAKLKQRSAR